MEQRYIAAAVPFFFSLIAVEWWWNRKVARDSRYRFHDSIANLSCGIGQQVCEVFYGAALLAVYAWVYERGALWRVSPRSLTGWIAVIVGLDLAYYAFHRASHRVNFIWAAHAVHHQSEEYNLSVALRQSWVQVVMASVFYLPLAVLGFPPVMFMISRTVNTLYQFWIHTRAVGWLGQLEWVLNTPSHHRVHHGIDPIYIDKNYAGIFIVWDRLFGTFVRERGEPVYGTVKPLSSWNPLWANLEGWAQMARLMRRAHGWRDKLLVPLMPPEWRPAELGGRVVIPAVSRAAQRRYDVRSRRWVDLYVGGHFVVVTVAASGLLLMQGAPRAQVVGLSGAILLSLVCFGGLVEGRRWALWLEPLRLLLLLSLLGLFLRG